MPEYVLNLEVSLLLEEELIKRGFEVKMAIGMANGIEAYIETR